MKVTNRRRGFLSFSNRPLSIPRSDKLHFRSLLHGGTYGFIHPPRDFDILEWWYILLNTRSKQSFGGGCDYLIISMHVIQPIKIYSQAEKNKKVPRSETKRPTTQPHRTAPHRKVPHQGKPCASSTTTNRHQSRPVTTDFYFYFCRRR